MFSGGIERDQWHGSINSRLILAVDFPKFIQELNQVIQRLKNIVFATILSPLTGICVAFTFTTLKILLKITLLESLSGSHFFVHVSYNNEYL